MHDIHTENPPRVQDLSSWPDADALLDEALGLPVADRRAFIRARAHDPAFRQP
ncbi:MAG: hypothetical protein R2712_22585 [Vicinamibacterales bacterium]